jgi:hypothetical protein
LRHSGRFGLSTPQLVEIWELNFPISDRSRMTR